MNLQSEKHLLKFYPMTTQFNKLRAFWNVLLTNYFENHQTKSNCCFSGILFIFLNLFYLFIYFYFTILYWFCHTLTSICHGCTCVPHPEPPSHLPPHPIPLGHPSAPDLSTLYHALNLDWWFISHVIIYMFQCHSPISSRLRPLPQSPKDCSIHLCLFCCLAYRVIITIFLNSIYMC